VRVEQRPERLGVGRGAHGARGLPNGLDQRKEVAVLGEHGVDQHSSARILMRLGVHGLLLGQRMGDQLGLAPPDQGVGCGAGTWQIAPGRGVDKRLHLDGKGTGQLCVMILDGLDGPGIRGTGCDNDGTHETPPTQRDEAPTAPRPALCGEA